MQLAGSSFLCFLLCNFNSVHRYLGGSHQSSLFTGWQSESLHRFLCSWWTTVRTHHPFQMSWFDYKTEHSSSLFGYNNMYLIGYSYEFNLLRVEFGCILICIITKASRCFVSYTIASLLWIRFPVNSFITQAQAVDLFGGPSSWGRSLLQQPDW